ncbi:MAG: fumarylacetoacetate hydrolase family protein [Rhodospirillaceae bacterium]|nr:fumarylacetoacetate hydrolase family protein [Rhodospirillaceae bacterium]
MKLATLKRGGRDGTLVVVSRDLNRAVAVPQIAATLQAALDDWATTEPQLTHIYHQLNAGSLADAFAFDAREAAAPLPRAYHWVDGSAYLVHVELVRKARGAEVPASFYTDPLVYQGGSDDFLGPCDDIVVPREDMGIDLEAEVAVITGDVAMGTTAEVARNGIRLVMLVNDVSLRGLIPRELEKGFGFYTSKPATAFSPVAVTPDELGGAWDGGKVNLPLISYVRGQKLGSPNAGQDLTFDFTQLIQHCAQTRNLRAGTIVGSGTVANRNADVVGSSCLAEVRTLEQIKHGAPKTSFLGFGDDVRIEMLDAHGASIFGAIAQRVVPLKNKT